MRSRNPRKSTVDVKDVEEKLEFLQISLFDESLDAVDEFVTGDEPRAIFVEEIEEPLRKEILKCENFLSGTFASVLSVLSVRHTER